jgi:hypothetical protein
MTACVNCKGNPSATPSATPKNLGTHRRMSVDKVCYGLTSFGRQKVPVNRKYGHDTQGVAKFKSCTAHQKKFRAVVRDRQRYGHIRDRTGRTTECRLRSACPKTHCREPCTDGSASSSGWNTRNSLLSANARWLSSHRSGRVELFDDARCLRAPSLDGRSLARQQRRSATLDPQIEERRGSASLIHSTADAI